MAHDPELFRNIVESVLNSWTALRLAVEHGMGGFQSKEVALQLVVNLADLFAKNPCIGVEEVADYLTDIMDLEFQTICEDNSPDEVAAVLWQFHQHCKEGNNDVLNSELSRIPKSDNWLSKPQPTQLQSIVQSDTSNFVGGSVDAVMETEEVDPEWTQVKNKRRKERITVE